MRKVNFILAAAMLMVSAAVMAQQASKVYLTREISPESLVKIYKALGVEAKGRVAVSHRCHSQIAENEKENSLWRVVGCHYHSSQWLKDNEFVK